MLTRLEEGSTNRGALGSPGRMTRAKWRHFMRLSRIVIAGLILPVAIDLGIGTACAQDSLPAAPPSHRSLRDNAPASMPEPTEPHPFSGYAGAPAFSVFPQKDQLTFYPCSNCHKLIKPNTHPRKLDAPHPAALVHGNGRFWCLDCHQTQDRDHLHTIAGDSVDFNDSYLVCGQCHANRQKDWYFGGHGKRLANWSGDRVIYNCTHCHDPHSPSIKPRAPSAPPPLRYGLAPMVRTDTGSPPSNPSVKP